MPRGTSVDPSTFLAPANALVPIGMHPVSLWGAIGVFAWLMVFFTVIVPTSAWRDFAA